jgi:hypothetical protein
VTEPPRPRPRPGPAPRPDAARDGWTEPTLSGTPGPRPALNRLARRRAERRIRTRRWLAVVGAIAAVFGVAMFAVAATRHEHTPGHRAAPAANKTRSSDVAATSAASSAAPKVSGATLLNPDLALTFLAGASSDLAAVTSYDYRHLDDALNVGLSVTTGAYQDAYRTALTGPVADQARKHHVVQTFRQLAAGIGEIDPDGTHATVLVFGLQTRSDDSTHGKPSSAVVTFTATIEHDGDSYLISGLDTSGTNAGLPPGSPDLTYAAEAARAEVANTLSYTRTGFDGDLQRALDGAAAPLRGEIANAAPKAKAAMLHGKVDLAGSVTALAVRSAEGSRVELLVAATGYQVADDGTRTAISHGRYEVSVALLGGSWVTTAIAPIEAP